MKTIIIKVFKECFRAAFAAALAAMGISYTSGCTATGDCSNASFISNN